MREEGMITMRRYLGMSVLAAMGIAALVLFVKYTTGGRPSGMYEKVGKGIDEGLKESKVALDKATAHVQSVFEHVKNHKA
jgi:hypothetical protein